MEDTSLATGKYKRYINQTKFFYHNMELPQLVNPPRFLTLEHLVGKIISFSKTSKIMFKILAFEYAQTTFKALKQSLDYGPG